MDETLLPNRRHTNAASAFSSSTRQTLELRKNGRLRFGSSAAAQAAGPAARPPRRAGFARHSSARSGTATPSSTSSRASITPSASFAPRSATPLSRHVSSRRCPPRLRFIAPVEPRDAAGRRPPTAADCSRRRLAGVQRQFAGDVIRHSSSGCGRASRPAIVVVGIVAVSLGTTIRARPRIRMHWPRSAVRPFSVAGRSRARHRSGERDRGEARRTAKRVGAIDGDEAVPSHTSSTARS